jgi:hypothetical protein
MAGGTVPGLGPVAWAVSACHEKGVPLESVEFGGLPAEVRPIRPGRFCRGRGRARCGGRWSRARLLGREECTRPLRGAQTPVTGRPELPPDARRGYWFIAVVAPDRFYLHRPSSIRPSVPEIVLELRLMSWHL